MASHFGTQRHQAEAVLELLDIILIQAAASSQRDVKAEDWSWEAWLRKYFGESPNTQNSFLANILDVVIAQLDRLLERQVNVILHHPRFQKLEASWRGIHLLLDQAQEEMLRAERTGETVDLKIRALSVSKQELYQDAAGAAEFDQSQIWKKIFEMEFGVGGGTPFGALVADYEFENSPNDMMLLTRLAEVGMASFAPILTAPAPRLVDPYLNDFTGLDPDQTLTHLERGPDYITWRTFREAPDSRFVGLFLPRVLMRLPYDSNINTGFSFREDVKGSDHSKYLWGNAAFAFGCVLIRAFGDCGWFADIRGSQRGVNGAGLVPNLPVEFFATDIQGVCEKAPLEIKLDVHLESYLSMMGFVPLSACHDGGFAVFHTNQSIHQPAKSTDTDRTVNERISSMLQYALCVGRFAHYLKSKGRQLLGSQKDATDIQTILRRWISQYVSEETEDPYTKAEHPLRSAEIDLVEEEGHLILKMRLAPHFQLDDLAASIHLQATLARRD